MCKHLEQILPTVKDWNLRVSYYSPEALESMEVPIENNVIETREKELMLRRLFNASRFSTLETEILLDKFVSNLSMADIARRHNFTTRQTAYYFYKKVLKKLNHPFFKHILKEIKNYGR